MFSYQAAALGELVDSLETGRSLVSTEREARKTLAIMLAMLKSHQKGNVRVDLPIAQSVPA